MTMNTDSLISKVFHRTAIRGKILKVYTKRAVLNNLLARNIGKNGSSR